MTKKKEIPPPTTTTHIWTYLGRRWVNDKLHHFFFTHEGKTAAFTKTKAHVVGHRYSVEVDADGSSIFTNSMRYVDAEGEFPEGTIAEEHIARDELARMDQARFRLEKRVGDQWMNLTIRELQRVTMKLSSRDRQALAIIIASKIHPSLF